MLKLVISVGTRSRLFPDDLDLRRVALYMAELCACVDLVVANGLEPLTGKL